MLNDDGLDILMKLEQSNYQGKVAVMSGATDEIIESVVGLIHKLNVSYIGKLNKPVRMADFNRLLKSAPFEISNATESLSS